MIKEYMFKNNITQAELAEKLQCSPAYLCLVINGKKKPSERMKYKIDNLIVSEISDKNTSQNHEA